MDNDMSIGNAYADALRTVTGARIEGPFPDAMGDVPRGFTLRAHFLNGYGLAVARNGMSYGGECAAMLYRDELHAVAPLGTDIPPWNEYRLSGPQNAVRVARQVAALVPDVACRITDGAYDNPLPLRTPGLTAREAVEAYRARGDEIYARFRSDVFAQYGLTDGNTQHLKLWSLAWEHGHANGHGDVLAWVDTLADLIGGDPCS